jgi:hypothetical protein
MWVFDLFRYGMITDSLPQALPGGQKNALFERFLSKIPLKRVGSPAELAEAVRRSLSHDAPLFLKRALSTSSP